MTRANPGGMVGTSRAAIQGIRVSWDETVVKSAAIDSAMLTPRERPGLPYRRRPGGIQLTIILIVTGVLLGVRASQDGAIGALSAVPTILILLAVAAASAVISFGVSRRRLRQIRDRLSLGSEAISVRTTADFSTFPPGEISSVEAYTRPWHTYQLMTLTDSGIELRASGRSGARLRYSRMDAVVVGVAASGDYTERAILIAGREKGRSYQIGIVPVAESSMLLRPLDDEQFRGILDEIISGATATV